MHKNLSMEDLKYIINHEVGHYIWDKCLESKYKVQYKKLFAELIKNCKYNKDLEEDFSNSYANFIFYRYYFENDCLSKYEYFRKLSKVELNCNSVQ